MRQACRIGAALLWLASAAGCSQQEQTPATGEPRAALTERTEDWDGDGVAEVREQLDAHGRKVTADYFPGTVDAFSKSYRYDDAGRILVIEAVYALDGRTSRAVRTYDEDGGLIAVSTVTLSPAGDEEQRVQRFDPPCAPPYDCVDDC